MKVRVSKNLKGRIMIPILSSKPVSANQEFDITDTEFWDFTLQNALSKRYVVTVDKTPNINLEMKKIVNKSGKPIVLPTVGVLQPGRSASVKSDLLFTEDFKRLIELGKLNVKGDVKVSKPPRKRRRTKAEMERSKIGTEDIDDTDEESDSEWKPIILKPTEDGRVEATKISGKKKQPSKKNKRGSVQNEDGSIIIDPRARESQDNSDGIIFVDREQEEKRLANHPILSKKATSDIVFVDEEQAQERLPIKKAKGRKKK